MKPLRVALIGAGQIARVSHIPNYQSMEGVEVVAVCDASKEAAQKTAQQFSIPHYYRDHKEMLARQKPDLVSVCVPNKFHCDLTCDALEQGCHVMCEKPPAVTVKEAVRMEETAVRSGRLLTYGFHFRHGGNVIFLKEKIARGELGDIYGARVQWIRRRGIPGWGNFTNKSMQGGGPLIDIGAHMLDLALYLMDYPEISYVCAAANDRIGTQGGTGLMGSWDGGRFTVEDSLFGFIRFRNGASLNLETAFALHIRERDIRQVCLFGERMGAQLFPLAAFGEENGKLFDVEYPFPEETDLHRAELRNFVAACRGEAELLVTPKQATYLQRVLCALYESAESGRPVTWE